MSLVEIMLAMLDGKETQEETAARLFTAYTGKPCTVDDVKDAKEDEK